MWKNFQAISNLTRSQDRGDGVKEHDQELRWDGHTRSPISSFTTRPALKEPNNFFDSYALAIHAIKSFNKSDCDFADEQKEAVTEWPLLYSGGKKQFRVALHRSQGHNQSRCQLIDILHLQRLLDCLSEIFFMGALEGTTVNWTFLSDKRQWRGVTWDSGMSIDLNPHAFRARAYTKEPFYVQWRQHIKTLLHEACRAFLERYGCRRSCCQIINLGPDGHGAAWRLLLRSIQEHSRKLLGFPYCFDVAKQVLYEKIAILDSANRKVYHGMEMKIDEFQKLFTQRCAMHGVGSQIKESKSIEKMSSGFWKKECLGNIRRRKR